MDDLNKALGQIAAIRIQMARSTQFRGYGPSTVALTGALAFVAAIVQASWLPNPASHPFAYLSLWGITALVSVSAAGIQMVTRTRRIHAFQSGEMIRTAVEQFLPALVAGGLATLVIASSAPGLTWILPALWQIIFSLGLFASSRFLPSTIRAVGVWYLLTGLACLACADERALHPAAMGAAFGMGQFLLAAILWRAGAEGEDHV